MLIKPTMESLLKKVDSRYTLAILAAKRARQLVNGALPLSCSDTPNFVTLACEEIGKGRIIAVKGIHDIYIPLRPEIAAERLAARAAIENAKIQEALDESFTRTKILEHDDMDDDDLLADDEDELTGNETAIEDLDSLISKFIPPEDEFPDEEIAEDISEDDSGDSDVSEDALVDSDVSEDDSLDITEDSEVSEDSSEDFTEDMQFYKDESSSMEEEK
ncbi:MAG: DNA-directed RNA polymerase subunit omega [Saccharofermentanales bacterium]